MQLICLNHILEAVKLTCSLLSYMYSTQTDQPGYLSLRNIPKIFIRGAARHVHVLWCVDAVGQPGHLDPSGLSSNVCKSKRTFIVHTHHAIYACRFGMCDSLRSIYIHMQLEASIDFDIELQMCHRF